MKNSCEAESIERSHQLSGPLLPRAAGAVSGKPSTDRIAVKVINHPGDEVMKVFVVG